MSQNSYLVSARKYRPQLFGDIVSQRHVSETLKNAIRLERLAHAYLFTGPRGVGKTTAARVLAKAINCTTPLSDRTDQSEPCRDCESCLSFEQGRNLNIIEIDAASNNKVDDARDLRETVRIPPQGAKMKVYIIDEVHMLTTQAFNALLKTLEEPPAHALFIFATTEPHKVPATIQSRCQRFDFRRIATAEIVDHLKTISVTESITIDEESLMLIGRKGDGALRDALSVFDQAISLCGDNVSYDELVRALGVVDTDLYFSVTQAVRASDMGSMFRIVEKIVTSGYDLQEFLDGLEEHLRHLLVVNTVGVEALLDLTAESKGRFEAEASEFKESTLLRLLHIAAQTSDSLRMARQPRLRLELALVKMASLPASVDIRTAIAKLDKLDKAIQDADLSAFVIPPKPISQSPRAAVVTPPVVTPADEPIALPSTETVADSSKSEPTGSEDSPARTSEPDPPTPAAPAPASTPTPSQSFDFGQPALTIKKSPASERGGNASASATGEPASATELDNSSGLQAVDSASEASGAGEVAVLEPRSASQRAGDEATNLLLETLQKAWDSVIADMMDRQIRLGSILRHSLVVSVSGEHAGIAVPDDFHKRMLLNEKSTLGTLLSEHSGESVHDLHFVIKPDLFKNSATASDTEFDSKAFLKKKCEDNPAILALVERFGGEIMW